jgi:hypothetical protein
MSSQRKDLISFRMLSPGGGEKGSKELIGGPVFLWVVQCSANNANHETNP